MIKGRKGSREEAMQNSAEAGATALVVKVDVEKFDVTVADDGQAFESALR